jgi:hypothetical protein
LDLSPEVVQYSAVGRKKKAVGRKQIEVVEYSAVGLKIHICLLSQKRILPSHGSSHQIGTKMVSL